MPYSVGGRTSRIMGCFPDDSNSCNSYKKCSLLPLSELQAQANTFAPARLLVIPSFKPRETQSGMGPPQNSV